MRPYIYMHTYIYRGSDREARLSWDHLVYYMCVCIPRCIYVRCVYVCICVYVRCICVYAYREARLSWGNTALEVGGADDDFNALCCRTRQQVCAYIYTKNTSEYVSIRQHTSTDLCVCVCVCARACVRACVRVCVCVCARRSSHAKK